MKEKVLKFIEENKLLAKGDKVILGISGGPDSMFMLDILNNISKEKEFELIVCHFNHQIRKEAIEDQNLVETISKNLGIKCYIQSKEITKLAKASKRSIEDEGRIQRYLFFKEIYDLENANKLAIAHNLNDNAETVFLNLIRGSGTKGLVGIYPKSKNFGMEIIRPILNVSKDEILTFNKENNVEYKIDRTNKDNTYSRNKIRNEIMPKVSEINPNYLQTIFNFSNIVKEQESYLNDVVLQKFNNILIKIEDNEVILNAKKLVKEDIEIQKRIIFMSIDKLFGNTKDIGKVHIEDIIKMINKNIGNKYLMPNKNVKVYVNHSKIYITKSK